ncbi:MAG: 3-oxoacid CoA-transferase subunit B [Negativicutes bacterium]|nr:3-oxoacid CoA-transferase subunit B [Negativicutes bacterium]
MDYREQIARRAALELKDGEVVNLGFGMPTGAANFIPPGVNVILQSENGCLMFGPTPKIGAHDADVANAGGQPITLKTGASLFDLSLSFSIIRGGHVDATILGALEVDQEGNIANWAMPVAPGKYSPGMGGAMDLCVGARKVVAVLQHTDKKGESKILKQCTLPLTGKGVVDVIITDKAVFHVNKDGLVLKEVADGMSAEDIRAITEASFTVAPDLCEYRL